MCLMQFQPIMGLRDKDKVIFVSYDQYKERIFGLDTLGSPFGFNYYQADGAAAIRGFTIYTFVDKLQPNTKYLGLGARVKTKSEKEVFDMLSKDSWVITEQDLYVNPYKANDTITIKNGVLYWNGKKNGTAELSDEDGYQMIYFKIDKAFSFEKMRKKYWFTVAAATDDEIMLFYKFSILLSRVK